MSDDGQMNKVEIYSDMLSNMRAELDEKEELLRDMRVKYQLKAETVSNLVDEVNFLSERVNFLTKLSKIQEDLICAQEDFIHELLEELVYEINRSLISILIRKGKRILRRLRNKVKK